MTLEQRKTSIEFPPLLEDLFKSVQDGSKTLELRKSQYPFTVVKVGDLVILKSRDNERIKVEIIDVRNYENLDAVLEVEDIEKLAPKTTEEQRKGFARRMFPSNAPLILFEFKKAE